MQGMPQASTGMEMFSAGGPQGGKGDAMGDLMKGTITGLGPPQGAKHAIGDDYVSPSSPLGAAGAGLTPVQLMILKSMKG